MAGTAPLIRHRSKIDAIWPGRFRRVDIRNVRRIAGTNTWSQHAYDNAGDYFSTRTKMNAMASWASRTAATWSVAHIIWEGRIWSYRTRRWTGYGGSNRHTTHVHIDYLPQWTGTPPGRPVGTAAEVARDYPVPPTTESPYRGGWLRVVATGVRLSADIGGNPDAAKIGTVATAVARLKRRNRLPATTVVDARTWNLIGGVTARRGLRGSRVLGLQYYLRRYGFLPTSGIDGSFGPQTQQAVARFQAAAKVRVTGVVARNDWRALFWGPTAWATGNIGTIHDPDWVRPADGQPKGRIDHSWEHTLRALAPIATSAGRVSSGAARSIRNVIR